MRAVLLATAIAGVGAAAHAQAQDTSWPFSADGTIALGATDRINDADVFMFGDGTLRLGFARTPFGAELGAFGYVNSVDSPHETYGVLTWDFAFGGKLSVGVARPAYDGFAVSKLDAIFPTLGADRSTITRSEATWGAMYDGYLPWGVRFENDSGPLRYAVSIHDADNKGVSMASFGAAWDAGPWTFSGAIEGTWNGPNDTSAKFQAAWAEGRMAAGLGLYAPGKAGESELVEGFASYDIFPRLKLSGVVQMPLDGTDPTIALSGRFENHDTVGINLGVAEVEGADPVVNAFVDWHF